LPGRLIGRPGIALLPFWAALDQNDRREAHYRDVILVGDRHFRPERS
jgi:hypothetical protein